MLRKGRGEASQLALVVTDGVGQIYPVDRCDSECVSCAGGTYPVRDARRIILADGRTLYLIHADLPARQEAERIRQLEEAAFLRALFAPRPSGPAGVPLPFWALVFGMLVGMVVLGVR